MGLFTLILSFYFNGRLHNDTFCTPVVFLKVFLYPMG